MHAVAPTGKGYQGGATSRSKSQETPPAKRQRTAAECLSELKDLENLWDCGVLTEGEFTLFKAKLLRGE